MCVWGGCVKEKIKYLDSEICFSDACGNDSMYLLKRINPTSNA